ncbi:MAG: PA14 domain-containing protein [Sedimentisphaerales bacterium]|nr:PA14 domain-containing protein [Sedimentisphaerales bacterium]
MSNKTKHLVFVFLVAFSFSSSAMAVIDIAISTQAGWFSQGAADREMQEIADNVTGALVEQFGPNDQDALADWVIAHTGDGLSDLLIMCGQFPDTIYEPGNSQDDGSLAELFLDDGNCIVNTGDYMFYVVNGAGTNGEGGIRAMMDNPSITMWDDDTQVVVTADGQEFTPTLVDYATDRPFHLDELDGAWEAELILAQNDAGTRADPVIVHNTETGGRLGIFYQTASQDNDPRGEVISEWINNWYLPNLGSGGGNPFARRPVPDDGALHEDTWISLAWRAGYYAVSHDVYMGTNFDDVDAGAEGTFIGNQAAANAVAGFPGFAFPDGLIPGTTYYWRVDEVNDADPNSPWKGPVWSFSIPPKTAYNAMPADGAKFIDVEADLSWTEGFGGKLHTVYFGDNFDDVNNAAGGLPQGTTTYALDTLEPDKTYYWRVDEFDAITTYKGDVWSFTTAKVGGGVKGEYFSGMDLGNLVLTRTDPQINFAWGDAGPDDTVGVDNFSARWTGEVEAAFTETYTFYSSTDDGVRLWVDGQQIIDRWIDQGTTEHRGTIDLVAGSSYGLVMEYYENGGGAVAELRWSSPSTPKELIPQAALSLPVKANQANPANNAVDVSQKATLSWSAGDAAASHEVYFGTDADAVRNADSSSAEYKGSKQLGSESYDPGPLEWDTTYYWRVDEVEDGGTIQTGNLWSFTTANFLIVDNMESYNDINEGEEGSNRIYLAWIDGFDNPATNGSTVGHLDPPFAEQTIVHSGNQSMPFAYDNGVGKSEATLTLTDTRNWTENGVDTLAIWYIGDAANAAETMYVILNGTASVDNPDANAAQVEDWTEWKISLSDFNVNLNNVNTISIGFRSVTGGSGSMYFDDVRLLLPTP